MKSWTPEQIKELRKASGLSQTAFGELCGVSKNYIYLLEKGVRTAGKPLKILLSKIEQENEKKEKEKKHGKRHL